MLSLYTNITFENMDYISKLLIGYCRKLISHITQIMNAFYPISKNSYHHHFVTESVIMKCQSPNIKHIKTVILTWIDSF